MGLQVLTPDLYCYICLERSAGNSLGIYLSLFEVINLSVFEEKREAGLLNIVHQIEF